MDLLMIHLLVLVIREMILKTKKIKCLNSVYFLVTFKLLFLLFSGYEYFI